MLTALAFLLIGLVAVLVLLLTILFIILCSPLRYILDLNYHQSALQFNFSLSNWAYGLQASRKNNRLNWQLVLLGLKVALDTNKPAAKPVHPDQPSPAPKTRFSLRALKQLALDSGLKEKIWILAKNIWHLVRPDKILIKARIGFSEPHYTGWLMAMAGTLQAMSDTYSIHVEGVWDEPCLEGELILAGRLVPIQLLWQLFKFIRQPEIRSVYKRIRSQKSASTYQTAA